MTAISRRAAAFAWGFVLLALAPGAATAQFGYFGQNKIQYRAFDWHVLRGAHVDLYHYPEEQELARVALAYAEESYAVLERRFEHHPHRRIPLIIYASHSDFEQTNVLPFVPPEGLLGVTEFLKRRVALPFTGSYAEFRHTLRHELVHVFQLSLATEVSARYPRMHRAEFPLWWSEGLAEYFSAGEDTRDEMVLRDLTVSGRLPALGELAFAGGGIIYPLGGSIHRFLAASYGEWRIGEMYRDVWKYVSFEDAVRGVYGKTLVQVSDEWQYWMRQRYYPAVTSAEPLAVTARVLTRFAIKPTVYGAADAPDSAHGVLYFSPFTGYTNIYAQPFSGSRPRAVVKGERSAEFESFHFFESRLDVSPDRVVAFSSRYEDRDALFLWSLAKRKVIGRYQFADLVSILSPAWAPDGRSVVFSGLAVSGYSDLYRLWLPEGRLERLTSDRYQDLDPTVSPDGRVVVFSSDRTPFGAQGARNLFKLDLASGAIAYVTYGDWRDDQPRWASDGRIFFTSDRDGAFQIYSVDAAGNGRRETNSLNGAFDPAWVDREHGLVFGGFADLSYNIYLQQPAPDSAARPVALAPERAPPEWTWEELANPQYARAEAAPYERKFTFDFVAGDAAFAPGIGSAQGAIFLFSDLLGDHALFATVSSFQGNGLGNLIDNFNGTVFYLNQARRVNWGVGAFRLRGTFYESDFSTVYDETSAGAFAQLRYPLSRFRRIEAVYNVEHSDRFDLTRPDLLSGGGDATEFHRVGWLASSYLGYVEDNTLWLPTGPIDGERMNLTGGLVNDVSHGRFDSWIVAGDYRRYVRTSLRTAFALRLLAYHSGGERPRPVNIGGSWALRGYPRYGYVAGTRAWLFNSEWRFPITEFLSIGFPFGEARFPGVQGAVFCDLGKAWTATSTDRGTLGSTGLGLRMPIGPPLVLRLDLGYRFHSGSLAGYSLPAGSLGTRFVDFFFGFNY